MEADVMRRVLLAALALASHPALAACDLNEVVGYQLLFGKTIDGYVEDGKRQRGFGGCTRDRVLVFSDNTGVRCKETFIHRTDNPRGYLFARSGGDMKLCVDDDFYDVAPAQ